MGVLENINSPDDIKGLESKQLVCLADELRQKILYTAAANGGHLSSNLGIVEATIALHRVFNAPSDRIIFDVSHQSYAHKLLTGRYDSFSTLRKTGGISGFSNPAESPYDPCYAGHCGTSISEALGFAVSDSLDGRQNYTVAVVGDGAFTNGMIYEALNNCSDKNLRLIILLNDNEMSISENIGGLNKALRKMRSSAGYFRFKHGVQRILRKIPLLGKAAIWLGRKIKNLIKDIILKENVFENLGLDYIGPVDGNDIKKTCSALAEAKSREKCCVVHIYTKKGMGYPPAEAEPVRYHAVSPFDVNKGAEPQTAETFSSRFGGYISRRAQSDGKICAITAAMGIGTGLTEFAEKFPERFFDVGIAESHAVTFGAGLAAAGKMPVCAMYSTFSQRAYDQFFQDVSLAGYHFILALDRCGLVEGDGITHQGIFDYAMLTTLPGITVYSPANFEELDFCLDRAFDGRGLQVVRYPKGGETLGEWRYTSSGDIAYTDGADCCEKVIITYGRIAANALPCVNDKVGVVRFLKVFPIDFEALERFVRSARDAYILEEGIYEGGFAQKIAAYLISRGVNVRVRAIHGFVPHGDLADMFEALGMSAERIQEELDKME